MKSTAVLLALSTVAAGCATAAAPSATGPMAAEAPSAANAAQRHLEVHWVRGSAEYRALTFQVYRDAAARIQALAPTLAAGEWAVAMDADDTVLDNSAFEARLAESGETFEERLWDEWVYEEAAGAVPGAVEFIHLVQSLGGRVAIVTNRDERLCPATRRNLAAIDVRPAVVLCETDTGEKEPRYRMIEKGTASSDLPPLHIVMWVGDNIQDFPGLDQSLRTAPAASLDAFGRRFFIVPNPMYGSWMGNPWR